MKTTYNTKLTMIFEYEDGTREELIASAWKCAAGLVRRDDPYQDIARSLSGLDSCIDRLDYDFSLEAEYLRDIVIKRPDATMQNWSLRPAEQLLTGQEA